MASESTIDDIIKTVERFRILSVGRSGVGKSSLINSVFGITGAHVSHFKPGEADIQQEFVSHDNPFFVLHDSKGFEPGDVITFETVREFIVQRSQQGLALKDRIHCVWLCTKMPTAGGRVFEVGDEKLLKLAHETQVPVVIVFTQYDRLVRTKKAELKREHKDMDVDMDLDDRSKDEAQRAFDICTQSLQRTMHHLGIAMPHYVKVSIRPGYQEDVSALVEVTRDIVKERLKGDAWIMWAIAQRASLPVKIEACLTKGISYYRSVLSGSVPGFGQMLLRNCLVQVHTDIIRCWNFKGEVLNTDEFKQLMLHLVQDVHTKSDVSTPPSIDVISQFVTLVTAASAPIAPPVAILGLTYIFLQWLSTTVLKNIPGVQRLLIAYVVDLINVLKELFDFTLRPASALAPTWDDLHHAFETYERSSSRQHNHNIICSKQVLAADDIDKQVHRLVKG